MLANLGRLFLLLLLYGGVSVQGSEKPDLSKVQAIMKALKTLTPEQLRQGFALVDADGDKALDIDEVKAAIPQLIPEMKMSDAEVFIVVEAMDTDKNKKISFDELVTTITGVPEPDITKSVAYMPERHPVMKDQAVGIQAQVTVLEGRIGTEVLTKLKIDSDYNAKRLRMESSLRQLNDRIWRDGILTQLCQGQVDSLLSLQDASASMVGISSEHQIVRKNLTHDWKELADTQVVNTQEINGKVLDAMQRIQAERDAPSITRGNGERMDAFVLAQDEALVKLEQVSEIGPQITEVNDAKMERTIQSYKAGKAELQCRACNSTREALLESLHAVIPEAIETHKASCLKHATPPGVAKQVEEVKQQMAELDTDYKAQTKLSAERMGSLKEEKARLTSLRNTMLK